MRRGFSRLLLVLLLITAIALVVKMVSGPSAPEGFVVFGPALEMKTLYEQTFALLQPTEVVVHGIGSFAWDADADVPLAAYGWLVRRSQAGADLVWKMTPENTRHRRGTLAEATDTLRLTEGVYDVFFTTYGVPEAADPEPDFFERTARYFDRDYQRWHADTEHWLFHVAPLTAEGYRVMDHEGHDLHDEEGYRLPGVLWEAAPLANEERKTFLFQVHQPAELRVVAVGDAGDAAFIARYPEGDTVWTVRKEAGAPAGGSARNQQYEGVVSLAPGLYRAVAETDAVHAYGSWEANPPDDPHGWGLRLHPVSDPARITAFDPWGRLPQIAELTKIGNRQLRSHTFAVDRELSVVVHLLTEGNDEGHFYDYGWITSRATGESVWDARQQVTQTVGENNRYQHALSFLTLAPGQYTAYFQSDDRYAYGDFDGDPPPNADRWGLAVFSLDPTYQPSEGTREALPASEAVLVQLHELTDDRQAEADFRLDTRTTLRVYAVGEIMPHDEYDHGWIERVETEEKVWAMTWENTIPAGGASKNRKFDGLIRLPPGQYRAYFVTDDSHAFGTFNDTPPDDPAAWGITISRAPDTPNDAPPPPPPVPPRNR